MGTVPADTEMVIEGRTNGAWYLITFEERKAG